MSEKQERPKSKNYIWRELLLAGWFWILPSVGVKTLLGILSFFNDQEQAAWPSRKKLGERIDKSISYVALGKKISLEVGLIKQVYQTIQGKRKKVIIFANPIPKVPEKKSDKDEMKNLLSKIVQRYWTFSEIPKISKSSRGTEHLPSRGTEHLPSRGTEHPIYNKKNLTKRIELKNNAVESSALDRVSLEKTALISFFKEKTNSELTKKQAEVLVEQYPLKTIRHYIENLSNKLRKAKNPVGLLFRALNEKWDINSTEDIRNLVRKCVKIHKRKNENCGCRWDLDNPRDYLCHWCEEIFYA